MSILEILKVGFITGIFATQIMDLAGLVGAGTRLTGLPRPSLLGRWMINLFLGKFNHEDIRNTREQRFEFIFGIIIHYVIGGVLGIIYISTLNAFSLSQENYTLAIIYGLLTNLFPWFILFPSYGFGRFGLKGPSKMKPLRTSFTTHFFFGLGIALWLNVFVNVM